MTVRKSVRDARTVEHFEEVFVWLRMGDEDLKRYGGPEWVAFDVAALYNAPASELAAYEAEIGFPIILLLHEFTTFGARATRAALFIARRRAGVEGEKWYEFDPQTMHVKQRDDRPDEPDTATPAAASANGTRPGQGKSRRGVSAASKPGSEAAPSTRSSTTSAPS